MKTTDPIADLLTRIRNAHLAKHDRLDLPAAKLKLEVCRILQEEGYIRNFRILEGEGAKKNMRVLLRYGADGEPAIRRLRRVSRPGRRVYRAAAAMRPVLNGLGIGIVSTSHGVMTDGQARERRIGGEILCEIW